MRVLISGGLKTHNIVEGISKKFTPSGDEFTEVQFLDDIMNIFTLGDYFDKALITEQSITKDKQITDEMEIRQRINKFATDISKKPHRYNFVFMASNENMAQMIYDEILPIADDSAVVLKEPPYKTTFFIDIIVTEAKDLPSEWVYEPELNIPEADIELQQLDDNSELFSDMNSENDDIKALPTEDEFEDSLGGFDGFKDDFGSGFDINDGENIPASEKPQDLFDSIGDSSDMGIDDFSDGAFDEGNFENVDSDDNQQNNDSAFDVNGNTDNVLDVDDIQPIEQSEELPTYGTMNEQPQQFIPGFDDFQDEETQDNTGFEPEEADGFEQNEPNGFEQADSNDMQGTQEFNEDSSMYDNNGFGKNGSEYQQDGQQMFGDGMYGSAEAESGFSNEMYQNSEDEYHDNVDNNIYQDTPQGFENSAYTNMNNGATDAMTAGAIGAAAGTMLGAAAAEQASGQTQKKGFLSKMLSKQGNNAQQQPVNGPVQPVFNQTQQAPQPINNGRKKINVNAIKEGLRPFAARGNSIVVTGCGGCGTSFIAYSLANIINQLGYTVLLVDMDTQGKTQSYITKSNYDSMEVEDAKLMSAINSSNNLSSYETIVKQGFHLLTMGMGSDTAPVKDILHKEKLSRFVNISKTSHNFIIYDIPFNDATDFLAEITYTADNLVLAIDASNWGIAKTMLSVCNIGIEDMQDTVFNRAQIVFNRYRNLTKLFGRKVRTGNDITKVMDSKVQELIGEDPGFHFEDMLIAGIINDDPDIENGWYEDISYSDTRKGQEVFVELVEHIILKK